MKKHLVICFLSVFLFSCNTLKYVGDEEYLIHKNKTIVDDKRSSNSEVRDYIIQRPNTKIIGVPFGLHFYNFGNLNYGDDYRVWASNHEWSFNSADKIFTTKQAVGMSRFFTGLNNWFLNTGEAPVIYDPVKANKSTDNIKQYYFNEGYFDAVVKHELQSKKPKRGEVNYIISRGSVYQIDSISKKFPNSVIDSIYRLKSKESLLKSGDDFKISNIENEADRLVNLYRDNGIYYFNKNLVKFVIDTSFAKKSASVEMLISNPVIETEEQPRVKDLQVQQISDVIIYSDYSYNQRNEIYRDTTSFNNYTILSHDKLAYSPKTLTEAVFVTPGEIYKDKNRLLTRTHLRSLNNFKSVKVVYEDYGENNLRANVFLTPMKKYNLTLNNEITHSNVKNFGISAKFSFLNRNTFRHAEIFKLSFSGSFFNTSADISNPKRFFNAWEFGVDASLTIPKVLLPFNLSNIIAKEKSPSTIISLGTSLQKNIGLDNQKYTAIYDLGWQANPRLKHRIEILNTQYVKNLNIDEYFYIYSSEFNELLDIQQQYFPGYPLNQENAIDFLNNEITADFQQVDANAYQETQNIEKRYYIITDNNFIPTIAYSLTYSTQNGIQDQDFSYFRSRFASSGLLSNALAKTPEDGSAKSLFGAPIAQYFKLDLEYKKFWEFQGKNSLAFRAFAGFAIPYGNSSDLPFSRSYFVGGANDIRAWEIYELGPGASFTGLEYNVGSMKLLTSLEYRFNLLGKLNGAFFVDAGNIWDISNSSLNGEDAKFKGIGSLKNTAVGSGFGARYDFSFLVLRLDFGFKTYEPYNSMGSKWFRNYNFGNAVYNIGINYPF